MHIYIDGRSMNIYLVPSWSGEAGGVILIVDREDFSLHSLWKPFFEVCWSLNHEDIHKLLQHNFLATTTTAKRRNITC